MALSSSKACRASAGRAPPDQSACLLSSRFSGAAIREKFFTWFLKKLQIPTNWRI